jgi:hypothetical protein
MSIQLVGVGCGDQSDLQFVAERNTVVVEGEQHHLVRGRGRPAIVTGDFGFRVRQSFTHHHAGAHKHTTNTCACGLPKIAPRESLVDLDAHGGSPGLVTWESQIRLRLIVDSIHTGLISQQERSGRRIQGLDHGSGISVLVGIFSEGC